MINWRQLEKGFWFGETEKGDWVSIASPSGGYILALVQPVGRGCETGCFDTINKAKSWADTILKRKRQHR